jgi:hypothetical protein
MVFSNYFYHLNYRFFFDGLKFFKLKFELFQQKHLKFEDLSRITHYKRFEEKMKLLNILFVIINKNTFS